jgi:trk system potassium uptake protein TrkA
LRVVVVGGGKVGGYLAVQLLETGKVVTVIEPDAKRARDLAESTPALVIEGDGTDITVLESAHIDRADWLVAVTGLDEVNLVACELGATLGVPRVLARLNDPRNRHTFAALDIPVVAVTDLIGEVIEREVDTAEFRRITLVAGGSLSVLEVEVPEGNPEISVAALGLPPETVLVALTRNGDTTVPGAESVLRAGDRVVAVTTLDGEPAVRDALLRRDG